jgi:hypothetical protein
VTITTSNASRSAARLPSGPIPLRFMAEERGIPLLADAQANIYYDVDLRSRLQPTRSSLPA